MKIKWNLKYNPTPKQIILGEMLFKIGWVTIGLKLLGLISLKWWIVLLPFEISLFCFCVWTGLQLGLFFLDKIVSRFPIFDTPYPNSEKGFSYVFFVAYIFAALLKLTIFSNWAWVAVNAWLFFAVALYLFFTACDFILWLLNFYNKTK